jgi:hypothetical protein
MPESVLEPGSFRDRSARVFIQDGEVFRGLNERALGQWEALSATRFFRRFTEQGGLVPTERIDPSRQALPAAAGEWAAVLRHESIPFVSYPYEWSFGMLQDAALLQLDLLLAALDEGMTLKDASAYNVQWRGAKPVFVDIASFERRPPGEPWVGYRQFCQLFLYPLLLAAYRDIPFHPWLRGSLEGIDPESCLNALGGLSRLRAGVLTHVYLQARAQAAYAGTRRDVKADLRAAGFDVSLIKANAARLRKLIAGLAWKRARSTWSDYTKCGHYEAADADRKRRFVAEAAASGGRRLVWDLGSNTGTFSRIAAEHARYVVAVDADHLAVERLYQALKQEGNDRILPLVGNLADPSPDLGWRNLERKRLALRGRPDLVLALALVHHVVIGANVPLDEFVNWLADLGADLVIEFVTREDPMVGVLLRNKEDQYADYQLEAFERYLASRYDVLAREPLGSGTRVMYWARPR